MRPITENHPIREALKGGVSRKQIAQDFGVSSATISYHASKLGFDRIKRPVYDWQAVQLDIDNGVTVRSLSEKYGFCIAAYSSAINRGVITPKNENKKSEWPLDILLASFSGKKTGSYDRKLIRRHFVNANGWQCQECEMKEWQGKQLTLEVDHIDGNPRNNALKNLRLLCPNCHSTTETWRGRNIGK